MSSFAERTFEPLLTQPATAPPLPTPSTTVYSPPLHASSPSPAPLPPKIFFFLGGKIKQHTLWLPDKNFLLEHLVVLFAFPYCILNSVHFSCTTYQYFLNIKGWHTDLSLNTVFSYFAYNKYRIFPLHLHLIFLIWLNIFR